MNEPYDPESSNLAPSAETRQSPPAWTPPLPGAEPAVVEVAEALPTPPPGPAPIPTWTPPAAATEQGSPTVDNPFTEPIAAIGPAGGVAAASPRTNRRGAVLVAGGVGALVAAMVTASAFVLTKDDDPGTNGPSSQPLTTAEPDPAQPASVAETDLRALLDRVRPAVVGIEIDAGFDQGEGTGFIVTSDGVIVTNAHVAGSADEILVRLSDGDLEPAELLGSDPTHDLAVIKIDREGLPTLPLGDSDPPVTQVGDGVIAVGNALGLEGELSVTTGIVSALDRTVPVQGTRLVSAIQTDAAINPGNSGGPLLNTRGEVIGINTAIAPTSVSNNVGFAISISSAKPIIEALRQGDEPRIAFLGVETETLTPQRADDEGVEATSGAIIVDIVEGAAADEAGLEIGDIVISIEGVTTPTTESLLRQIRRHRVGDAVELQVERDGDVETVIATLGRLPDDNV